MRKLRRIPVIALFLVSVSASSAETITCEYDALGRLVKVTRTSTTGSSSEVNYTYDAAGNRVTVATVTSGP